MAKRQIFDSKVVTELMVKFAKTKRTEWGKRKKLKAEIMGRTLPLINAAISKKRYFKIRADLQQECALKILKALPDFDKNRGDAFKFLWTVICNTCVTHAERLSRVSLSLDDEDTLREAEVKNQPESPEMKLIQRHLAKALDEAFKANDIRMEKGKALEIQDFLKRSVADGELFSNRMAVVKKLKSLGLGGKGSGFLIDKTLILLRSKLYSHKKDFAILKSKSSLVSKHRSTGFEE